VVGRPLLVSVELHGALMLEVPLVAEQRRRRQSHLRAAAAAAAVRVM